MIEYRLQRATETGFYHPRESTKAKILSGILSGQEGWRDKLYLPFHLYFLLITKKIGWPDPILTTPSSRPHSHTHILKIAYEIKKY